MRQDVLTALRQLVNKSLVVIDERSMQPTRYRYRLLKTIQEYASDRLRERGDLRMTHDNHLEYMLRLAEDTHTQQPKTPQQERDAWNRLIEHQADLRTALSYAEQSGNAESLLRLVAALQPFWVGRGLREEGTLWMQKALAAGHAAPARLRAALMYAWAWTYSSDADALKQLAPEAQACLTSLRAESNQVGIAQTLTVLGGSAAASGEFEKAQASFKEALSLFEAMGDRRAIHNVRHKIGNALQQQDSAAAEAWMLESIQRYSDAGEQDYLSTALADLAWLIEARDPRDARLVPLWRRSVQSANAAGDADAQSEFLYMLGLAEMAAGDSAQAGEHLAQSLQIGCDMGSKGGIEPAAMALREVDPARAEIILKAYLSSKQEAGDQEGIAEATHFLELVQQDD